MDEKKNNPMENVVSIDDMKLKRMKQRGNTIAMIEQFEILRLKLLYDQLTDKQEAYQLCLLTKYFMENGPTEPFRMSCKFLYEKYMQPYGL